MVDYTETIAVYDLKVSINNEHMHEETCLTRGKDRFFLTFARSIRRQPSSQKPLSQ